MSTEQTTMDLRTGLDTQIDNSVSETIDIVLDSMVDAGVGSGSVKNRHEAYGIAAEHLAAINGSTKRIKGDVDKLLATLPDQNLPAVEATSAIVNSMIAGAVIMIKSAAIMKKTLHDLYEEETNDVALPMEELADREEGFDEVENIEDEGEN